MPYQFLQGQKLGESTLDGIIFLLAWDVYLEDLCLNLQEKLLFVACYGNLYVAVLLLIIGELLQIDLNWFELELGRDSNVCPWSLYNLNYLWLLLRRWLSDDLFWFGKSYGLLHANMDGRLEFFLYCLLILCHFWYLMGLHLHFVFMPRLSLPLKNLIADG